MLFSNYQNKKLANNLKSLGSSKGKTLALCYDLGSDSLKVSYGFVGAFGRYTFGKIVEEEIIRNSTIQSDAYFDQNEELWHFGKEIEYLQDADFLYTVNIKGLLRLLKKTNNIEIDNSNSRYYSKECEFPKYYFPDKVEVSDDYREMVERDYTFRVNGCTPKDVCEKYFEFVSSVVYKTIPKIESKYNFSVSSIKLSVCYPGNVGKAYLEELIRLIDASYKDINLKVSNYISSTKSLSYFAKYQNKIEEDDHFLVFDIGDETISVSKANYIDGKVLVDGKYGHKEPASIGGNHIDQAIAHLIENDIEKGEVLGNDSYGSSEHVVEEGLYSKQLLMLKNIKKAKLVLSSGLADMQMFKNGVPISIVKHSIIQRTLNKDDLKKCLGVIEPESYKVASQIIDYIISETDTISNEDVNKIFIAGGTIETLGLLDYIKDEVKNRIKRKITVDTFESTKNDDDRYLGITEYEDSVYAPSCGGLYVALEEIQIKTCLYYSYGTFAYHNGVKFLNVFASKGSELNASGVTEFGGSFGLKKSTADEMYSVSFSMNDFKNKRGKDHLTYSVYEGKNVIAIGEKNDAKRKSAEKFAEMKVVGSGKISLKYNGKEVELLDPGIEIREGIRLNSEGLATPFIENLTAKKSPYKYVTLTGSGKKVEAHELVVTLEGFPLIDVSSNNDEI